MMTCVKLLSVAVVLFYTASLNVKVSHSLLSRLGMLVYASCAHKAREGTYGRDGIKADRAIHNARGNVLHQELNKYASLYCIRASR
jgi:hypothetical protein